MFNNSIDSKPIFTKPNGTKIKDLTHPFFNENDKSYVSYEVYKVPADYVMRPDLISKAVYNDSYYTEIILKFNGISNPFTISEGDIILIPNLDEALAKINNTNKNNENNVSSELRNKYKYIDPLKIPKKEKILNEFDNRQIVDVSSGALPPNISESGTSQITYRNGRVYFGDSVATCLSNGMSSSEFLTSVITKSK